MPRRKKFKIKSKPKKPERKMQRQYRSLYEGETLQYWLDEGIPRDAEIKYARYSGYESEEMEFVWEEPESEEQYQRRLTSYEINMAAYNKWYEENKEAIEEEIALREQEEKEKIKKRKERELKKAEKDLKKLEKKIKRMRGK